MRPYNTVLADPQRSLEMRAMQTWIKKFICGTMPSQNVVGNRIDHFSGQVVTQAMFNQGARPAHVCPFVDESIQRDLYFLDESTLTAQDRQAIETLLRAQIPQFINAAPAHDPTVGNQPAGTPALWKTFMTIFPRVKHIKGSLPLFDAIHQSLKPVFIQNGLMLGQFYSGCPQPAIYNPRWVGATLSSPIPAFAIRYLVRNDHLFIPTTTPAFADYKRYFP